MIFLGKQKAGNVSLGVCVQEREFREYSLLIQGYNRWQPNIGEDKITRNPTESLLLSTKMTILLIVTSLSL